MEIPKFFGYPDMETAFKSMPPVVQAAIMACFKLENDVDDMGYDVSYYAEDLPKVVARAVEPWKEG